MAIGRDGQGKAESESLNFLRLNAPLGVPYSFSNLEFPKTLGVIQYSSREKLNLAISHSCYSVHSLLIEF